MLFGSPNQSDGAAVMQPNDINSPTILLAIELSASTWLVAARVPGSEKPHLHRIDGGDTVTLLTLISSLHARVARRQGATIEDSNFSARRQQTKPIALYCEQPGNGVSQA
jgi:hypothetical protein